ncbi:MAG: hypothetical protein ACI83N_000217 [Hydrogenophaga sp.]|jgi:hypothetical protein
MKVLDLQCAHQHSFEGWFGSEDDFVGQLARGLVSCPLCGDGSIQKMLSAPRLNLRASRQQASAQHTDEPSADASAGVALGHVAPSSALQARFLSAMREVMANTEDVGERFADQARAMHHGDMDARSIRGRTSPQVALELIEEGISVLPLPPLPALKETLQ